jgi:hypothetical protein
MKFLIPVLFLAFTPQMLVAQNAPIKFGEIGFQDLEMTSYSKDPSAPAVVLADYGQSALVFNQADGFTLSFERITRIKILTTDGLDYASFSFPLYIDGGIGDKVTSIKGITYNLENNKIIETKLKNDAVFREKATENYDIMRFTLPGVRVGSVVEISYKIMSTLFFHFRGWEFQSTIPVRWSEYRANIPEYYHYDKYTQGYIPLTIVESEDVGTSVKITSAERLRAVETITRTDNINFVENRSRWVAQDVPAFKPEPYITTPKDYMLKLNFELIYKKFPLEPIKQYMGSWEDLNRTFMDSEYFGKQIKGNGFLKKTVEEITVGASSAEQKIAAINTFIAQNIEWNGRSHSLSDASFKKILEEKKGNSADINLLFASMLDKAGFNVKPVLLSTRDHGFVRDNVPISTQFNYVACIVKLKDKLMLLDATDKLLPTGTLPERCLNGKGLVIADDNMYGWVPLMSPAKSRKYFHAELEIGASADLHGKVQLEHSGYFGQSSRKDFLEKGEGDYIKDLINNRPWVAEKSEFKNLKEIREGFMETHEIRISDHIVVTNDLIYLNPFVDLQEKENPFKLEKREYPVNFGSGIEKLYFCKIKIPDGYVVEELPKNVLLKLPDNGAKYAYSLVQSGNSILLTSNLQINNSLFTQEQYPGLREFFTQLVAKQAEQVVLKKK